MIDELLTQARGDAELTIPASWGQGRTVFGGLSAALLNQAMVNELPDARPLRGQTCQFIGPLLVDEPCQLEVTHLRDGKNVTQLQARLLQKGQVAVQTMAAFGTERSSKLAVKAPLTKLSATPKKAQWMPQVPGVVPKFHRYIDIKIDDGGLPFTGKQQARYRGWMRFSDAPPAMTDAHLIALIDVWPPTVLQMLKWPAPASTLSWNIEFVHPHPKLEPTDWLSYDAITRQASDGYAHIEANIYAPNGQLLAISRQLVTVFA